MQDNTNKSPCMLVASKKQLEMEKDYYNWENREKSSWVLREIWQFSHSEQKLQIVHRVTQSKLTTSTSTQAPRESEKLKKEK